MPPLPASTAIWTLRVRPPTSYTNALKVKQIADYGYSDTSTADYEEDHFIPLELGGVAGEEGVRRPPVDAHLLRGVGGGDEQPHLQREQLDVEDVDDDVAGDDHTLVEDALEDVRERLTGAMEGRRGHPVIALRQRLGHDQPSSAALRW